MFKRDIDLNRVYDGSDIMNFYLDGAFEPGDSLIAFDKDYNERFTLQNNVYGLDFKTEDNDILDFWDLANLKFVIVPKVDLEVY